MPCATLLNLKLMFSTLVVQEFMSDFVVLQRSRDSGFGPMTVEIEGSIVTSGTAGSVFVNDGGLLRINKLDVVDLTATALIATSNNGASFMEDSTISRKFTALSTLVTKPWEDS